MKLENVCKKYGNKDILNNISLSVKKGKFNSIIGANGSGKSTLLKIMSRIVEKDKGYVLLSDNDIEFWNNNELAKKISILTQSTELNLKIRVRELVEFGRFPHRDNENVDFAIEIMDLKEIEEKYIDELSGGQLQRCLIAMIIAQDTEYILLDEPNNNLDIYYSKKLMQNLKLLCEKYNKTVIVVLHEINYVSFYSDYIFCMIEGELKYKGSVDEIIKKDILKEIYGIDFEIINIQNKPLTIFY